VRMRPSDCGFWKFDVYPLGGAATGSPKRASGRVELGIDLEFETPY